MYRADTRYLLGGMKAPRPRAYNISDTMGLLRIFLAGIIILSKRRRMEFSLFQTAALEIRTLRD